MRLRGCRLFATLAAALVLSLASCRDGDDDRPPPPPADSPTATQVSPSPLPADTPTPRPLPGVVFPPEQAQVLEDLVRRTAQLRKLEPLAPLHMRLIGRDAAADYLEGTLDEGDKVALARRQEVYRLLGLIPDDADLLQLQISLLRGAVLGFYDPDVKALFVLQDLGLTSVVTRTTIVHEIVHALQDQHYDLNAIDLRIRDDWDRYMAFTDVVEGDARGVETEFLSPAAAANPAANCNDASFNVNTLSNIPVVVQRELLAPYSDGRCLIASVASRLPEGVDSIFKDLPRSTEQVLHPEKYLAREEPRRVDLRPLAADLGSGWSERYSGTIGEFGLQNLLLLGVSDTAAVKRAAAGWGGDRWSLYGRNDGARLIHVETLWDSESEAREFWEAFLRSLNTRSRGSVSASASQSNVYWRSGGKSLRAALAGDSVTLLVGTDDASVRTAATALGLP
ncbi:MAG TPA: hypothetical protein VNN10_11345 [Dehalococcoidia bacterium]|nr:hypothetical protein [Dehalococcoidia bacterium]